MYLALRSLEWDTRDSLIFCSPVPIENEEFYSYLRKVIDLTQTQILELWPLDAPAIIVKIDIWVKRKRNTQQVKNNKIFLVLNLAKDIFRLRFCDILFWRKIFFVWKDIFRLGFYV